MPPSSLFVPSSPGESTSRASSVSALSSLTAIATLTDEEAENDLFRRFPGWLWSERNRSTLGWVWDFGYDINNFTDTRYPFGKYWVCQPCVRKRAAKLHPYQEKGTGNMMNHLFDIHRIRAPPGKPRGSLQKKFDQNQEALAARRAGLPSPRTTSQISITDAFQLDPSISREQQIANTFIRNFDKQHFQRLVIRYIVNKNRAFTTPEDEDLRAIFDYLSPQPAIHKAHLTGDAVHLKIYSEFQRHADTIIKFLAKVPGLIHISFDGWSSPNQIPLYGVACFFRDENDRPMKLTLGIPEVIMRHNGENIAEGVYKVGPILIQLHIGLTKTVP